MTDAELVALAAYVNACAIEAQAANEDRARKNQAPAYGEDWVAPGSISLERELRRRGVLKTAEELAKEQCFHCENGDAHVCFKDKPNG